MARIAEYDAPDRTLTASDKGANAFEQAGRRIGPAYNEAATLQRQAGEAQAATIRQRRWPWDILELERSLEETGSTSTKSSGSGYGVKVQGGINNLEHEKEGSARGSNRSRLGNDVGATSLAAGALGKLAPRLGATGQYHNSLIDPVTGLDLNLLKPTEPKQLVNGKLVTRKQAAAMGNEDVNGELAADAFAKEQRAGLYDTSTKEGAKAAETFRNKWGYDPNSGEMYSPSTDTGAVTDYGGGGATRSDVGLSGTDAYAPDSATTTTARGIYGGIQDNWSDITNSLAGVLRAGTTGEWPGTGKDYGGGSDSGTYADLTGEGAQ